MEFLDYIWQLLTSIIAGLIIAIGAVKAATRGAKMTAKASRDSVRETLEAREKRDKKRQQEIIQGVLEAIHQELYVIFHKLYAPHIEDTWKNFDEKKHSFYNSYIIVPEDYLIIFRSNANIIGQINDSELRFKVVNTYMFLQILLDRYKTNNKFLDQHIELEHKDPAFHAKIMLQLELLAPILRNEHKMFREMVGDLFAALAKEWSSTSTSDSAEDST